MNKILLTISSLVVGLTALAQGTVNINNNFTATGATSKAFVLGLNSLPLAKALGSVEVLDNTGKVIKSGGFGADGLFFLGVVEIPGATGNNLSSITIRAWDNATGSSYDSATVKGFAAVSLDPSKAVPPGYGGGLQPAPGLGAVGNFTGLQLSVVPEPSTYALGALGIVGLLFVARRK